MCGCVPILATKYEVGFRALIFHTDALKMVRAKCGVGWVTFRVVPDLRVLIKGLGKEILTLFGYGPDEEVH